MIITLIFLILFLVPALLLTFSEVVYTLKRKQTILSTEFDNLEKSFIGKLYNVFWRKLDFDLLGFITVFSGLFLFVCCACILGTHVAVDRTIEVNRIEYESLCDRLEIINSDYEDVSKSDVIKDISEWNKQVIDKKYWAKNPWTSWFLSQKIVDELKYIDYKENCDEN